MAFAYPDRIGQQRGDGRFLLSNGRGAKISGHQPLAQSSYIVAADLDGDGIDSKVFLAAPLTLGQLEKYFGGEISEETSVVWDTAAQAVRARRFRRLGVLVLNESPVANPDPEAVCAAVLKGIAAEGLSMLPWSSGACQLRQRLQFIRQYEQDWPDVSDEFLMATLECWLGPYIRGVTNRNQLEQLNLAAVLSNMLTWQQRQELDEYAPTHITVPSGQRIMVDYSTPDNPVLAVKLQELFGLTDTPRIARGKVAVTLHLLSPAQRPVQVTRDLASFWRTTYFEVKKDLMGRYPKHYWPDDPATAIPTNRVRPRKM